MSGKYNDQALVIAPGVKVVFNDSITFTTRTEAPTFSVAQGTALTTAATVAAGSGILVTGAFEDDNLTLAIDPAVVPPISATYITQTPNAALTAEQALSALATGYMKVTTTTGVVSSQAVPIPGADGGTGIGAGNSGRTLAFPASGTAALKEIDNSFSAGQTVSVAAGTAVFRATGPTGGSIRLDGPAGSIRDLIYYTGNVARWSMYASTTAEGGANAGSDYVILPFSDGGVSLTTALTITRANARATFGENVIATGTISGSNIPAGFSATGNGTLATGGFTLTVPATGTAALKGIDNAFSAIQSITVSDTATNTQLTTLTGTHRTSATPLTSFGNAWVQAADLSDNTIGNQMRLRSIWIVPTAGAQTVRVIHEAFDSVGGREYMRGESDGAVARIGFLGHAAVVRQATAATATDLATVITLANALKLAATNLGLTT